jgi:CheY-like chemotaxis protein
MRIARTVQGHYTAEHMSSPAVPPPIVVADSAPGFEQVRGTLSACPFPLVHAGTLASAKTAIVADTPLVLCSCHFDDGRLYELLRHLKARPALSTIPFLTVRVMAGELDDAMYESVKIATHALGGDGFVDLFRWQRLYGPDEARRQFTERVTALARGQDAPVG